MRIPKVRRQVHREFFKWWAANKSRFTIPLTIHERTDKHLRIGFVGYPKDLYVILDKQQASIYVDCDDELWDSPLWIDISPKRISGGYICSLWIEGTSPIFPDMKSMWVSQMFEVLLQWVNERLYNSYGLVLYGKPGCSTYAQLCMTPDYSDEAYKFYAFPMKNI